MKDLNDTNEALEEIAAALQSIQPDQVHLLLPLRPPAESWVQPADEGGLQRAQLILGKVAQVIRHGKHFWSAVGAYYAAEAAQTGKRTP